MKERDFYPLIEGKLRMMGKVTLAHKRRRGEEFIPEFVIESEDGKRTAVEVGCEVHRKHLVPKLLCQKAFQILVYLQRFDRVLYIAPHEELKRVCDVLSLVNVGLGERFQTADLGYMIGTEALDAKMEEMSSDLRRVKKAFKELEYQM